MLISFCWSMLPNVSFVTWTFVRVRMTAIHALTSKLLNSQQHRKQHSTQHARLGWTFPHHSVAGILHATININVPNSLHCKIYSTGTLRKNRKGWDEDMMRMMKAGDRGQADLFCCKLNDVIVHQWQDSGVVNVCSTTFDVWLWECTDKLVPTSCPSCVQTLFGNVNHVWC